MTCYFFAGKSILCAWIQWLLPSLWPRYLWCSTIPGVYTLHQAMEELQPVRDFLCLTSLTQAPQYQQPYGPGQFGQPPRPVSAQEYQTTATIRNQVNLKKHTLKLVPLEGSPDTLSISFSFDASAACRYGVDDVVSLKFSRMGSGYLSSTWVMHACSC